MPEPIVTAAADLVPATPDDGTPLALSRELMIAVDRYVALRWPLAGDAGVSVPDALAVLREEAGSRLPPDAVAALEQVEADGELP